MVNKYRKGLIAVQTPYERPGQGWERVNVSAAAAPAPASPAAAPTAALGGPEPEPEPGPEAPTVRKSPAKTARVTVWEEYAASLGLQVPPGATRKEIQALVANAN